MQAPVLEQLPPAAVATGDPIVIAALALGWEMADLYGVRQSPPTAAELPARLPAAAQLGPQVQLQAGVARVQALISCALPGSGSGAGVGVAPTVNALRELPEGDPQAWRQALYDLHAKLATALRASGNAPYGAYDLGRSLADTCRDPDDLSELMDRLDAASLLPIEGRLADLSSRLPPHAAAAVSATLEQWRSWTSDARARENMSDIRGALARQGGLWRALLTGDKDAREMLDPDTVIAASVRHVARLGTLIRGLAGASLPAVGLLTAATALLVYAIIAQSGIATVIAALGALAAALIVVRKGLSLTVTGTIEELRTRLWGAEIDAAVAQSILRLPPSAPPAPRPKLTLAKPAGAERQPATTRITERVERALHVTRSAKAQGFRVPASGPVDTAPEAADDGVSANGKPVA